MLILSAFAFIAGVVTILSPCILPVLPIILSSTVDNQGINRKKPLGVVTGFIVSFTFFTLFLSSIVRFTGIPADYLRFLSVAVIFIFGITLLLPQIQAKLEILFVKLSNMNPTAPQRTGFTGGVLTGLSLGLLWTPCVGPILASVISLAAIGEVSSGALIITAAYSMGTALPMLLIMLGGQKVLTRVPWLTRNTGNIQKVFGVLMILTALAIHFQYDRKFQTYILEKFPQYGTGLTSFEDTDDIKNQLNQLRDTEQIVEEKGPKAPELTVSGQWFNSEPLTMEQLRGKVVLIDFWTYSCINCQRTFPYLRDWWSKYKDSGLVIIGVHAPEFEFEKDPENVKKALSDFGLEYPVMQDNDFLTWRSYNNRYWPAKYLIDKDGYIRYWHFGEGGYDETEQKIIDLLREAGTSGLTTQVSNPEYSTYAKTPETYLGYLRLSNFASPEQIKRDVYSNYTVPSKIPNNQFAYEGEWQVKGEYSKGKEGSKLILNFESKDVFLVMNPIEGESQVRVFLDGEDQGIITIDSDSLYTLVELATPGRHILEIEFMDSNTEVYAFTFG